MNYANVYSIFIDTGIIRRAKGDKLVGDYPVEIAILYSFVMLVLVHIKLLIIEPVKLDGIFEPSQAVEHL